MELARRDEMLKKEDCQVFFQEDHPVEGTNPAQMVSSPDKVILDQWVEDLALIVPRNG